MGLITMLIVFDQGTLSGTAVRFSAKTLDVAKEFYLRWILITVERTPVTLNAALGVHEHLVDTRVGRDEKRTCDRYPVSLVCLLLE